MFLHSYVSLACFGFVIIKKGEIVGLRELRSSVPLTRVFRFNDDNPFSTNPFHECHCSISRYHMYTWNTFRMLEMKTRKCGTYWNTISCRDLAYTQRTEFATSPLDPSSHFLQECEVQLSKDATPYLSDKRYEKIRKDSVSLYIGDPISL